MNANNKVRFIHFRNVTPSMAGEVLSIKGGATVAWKFDDNGDIVVGAPAVCSIKDNFSKGVGRFLAADNLDHPTTQKPLAIVIPKDQIMKVLEAEVQSFQTMKFLTKDFRDQVASTAAALVADDPFLFVNIGWFEQKLRQTMVFHDNQVFFANGKVYGKQVTIDA